MNIKTPLVHITINSLNLGILPVEKSVAKDSAISRSGKARVLQNTRPR